MSRLKDSMKTGLLAVGFLLAPFTAYYYSNAGSSEDVLKKQILSPALQNEAVYFEDYLDAQDLSPISLAAGDFNSDGLPDLVIGFGAEDGGRLVLMESDPKTYGTGLSGERLFHQEVSFLEISATPDHLVVGDFNADGFMDAVVAETGDDALYLFSGNGTGYLREGEPHALPGTVTALMARDLNRVDGLGEMVVGVERVDGAALLIYQSRQGALNGGSRTIPMNTPVTALTAGLLDEDPYVDLAVASGSQLVLVRGDEPGRPLKMEHRLFNEAIAAMTAGSFDGESGTDLALLLGDGTLVIATGADLNPPEMWDGSQQTLTVVDPEVDVHTNAILLAAHHTGGGEQDLILSAPGVLKLMGPNGMRTKNGGPQWDVKEEVLRDAASPAAVIPMRLNGDALTDLVMLNAHENAPLAFLESRGGAVFEVNSTNDVDDGTCDGIHCSLREAINAANGDAALDTITFTGLSSGDQTISVNAALPVVTEPVTIDGSTHTDGMVALNGFLAGAGTHGLQIMGGSSTLRSLAVHSFGGSGVRLTSGDGNLVEGCLIGLDLTGETDLGNNHGLYVASSNNTLGGTAAGAGNVISGNTHGLHVESGDLNTIQGNYIGLNASGTTAIVNDQNAVYLHSSSSNTVLGGGTAGAGNVVVSAADQISVYLLNTTGVLIQGNKMGVDLAGTTALSPESHGLYLSFADTNTIGGSATGMGNQISGLDQAVQVLNESDTNTFMGNLIGVAADGETALGNQKGVLLTGSTDTLFGGVEAGEANALLYSTGYAFRITNDISLRNKISGNRMGFNGSGGIDLGGDGETPNDPSDTDDGPNRLINHPDVNLTMINGDGDFIFFYQVTSSPGTVTHDLTVEFFIADDLESGEGLTYLASDTYTVDDFLTGWKLINLGNAAGLGVSVGQAMVATTTDADNNTSEFSPSSFIASDTPQVFEVNTTEDVEDGACDDHCSLRDAIVAAGVNSPHKDTITFNIPGAGTHVINGDDLPTVEEPVIIDGRSQPGYVDKPLVVIDTGFRALHISAGDSEVYGLGFTNCDVGIWLEENGGNIIQENYIGSSQDFTDHDGNRVGVLVDSSDNLIGGVGKGNLVVDNWVAGLFLRTGENNRVQGNTIGSGYLHPDIGMDNTEGVRVWADNNLVGGVNPGEENLISGNRYGIWLQGTGNRVEGNRIGVDVPASTDDGNLYGVYTRGTGNTLGGLAEGAGNQFAFNRVGLWLFGNADVVQGNTFGLAENGVDPGPNATGVTIFRSDNNLIGGTEPNAPNIIAYNERGLYISHDDGNEGNRIQRNSFYFNDGLGIDLDPVGFNPNDPLDVDTGPNQMQNFPELRDMTVDGAGDLVVTYYVDTFIGPAYDITVEFYIADSPDSGEGHTFIAEDTFTQFDFLSNEKVVNLGNAAALGVGLITPVTALATNAEGNTSEFSPMINLNSGAAILTVNTTDDVNDGTCDSGHCSLREAILFSNLNAGFVNTIEFNIPGAGPHLMQPPDCLPEITTPVVLDGSTQPGYSGTPLIEFNGLNLSCGVGFNVSAGNSTIRGLAVTRWEDSAIHLHTHGGNIIENCHIGTGPNGNEHLGNVTGIHVSSSNNTIGGGSAARNIISGNGDGVLIDNGSSGNTVSGNYVGSDIGGTKRRPNDVGVRLADTSGNLIGGLTSDEGNLISGNDLGLSTGASSAGNHIQGNHIGLGSTGAALFNLQGVAMDGDGNTLGGTDPGAGNVISGNTGEGVILRNNSIMLGNLVGTDVSGTGTVSNGGVGVEVYDTAQVGDGVATGRNVISGNTGSGVQVSGGHITGNYIGVDVSGANALGNGESGVFIPVGFNALIQYNVISSNREGIRMDQGADGLTIQGNIIGLNAAGDAALGNGGHGVQISASHGVTLGGTGVGEGNLISGNQGSGVSLTGGDNHVIQANFLGTDATGAVDLGNSGYGLRMEGGSNLTVGGEGARNLVSGNTSGGLLLTGGATGASIFNNYVGTDVTGMFDLGNTLAGIILDDSPANAVGGTGASHGNLISGNADGVVVTGVASLNNVISGNVIGVDAALTGSLGNAGSGVLINGGSLNTVGPQNVIGHNAGSGVRVDDGLGNLITQNSIFSNQALGVDLNGDGPTLNDSGDGDAGPNQLQNFPSLLSITEGANITVNGQLDSTPNTTYTLEFFATASCDLSGYGQGAEYLGSETVTTDGSGQAVFSTTLTAGSVGDVITVTATDPDGNTSEFSACEVGCTLGQAFYNSLPNWPSTNILNYVQQVNDRCGGL